MDVKEFVARTPPTVQWLRFYASIAGDTYLIPDWGTKMSLWATKKKKEFVTILIPHMYPLPVFSF